MLSAHAHVCLHAEVVVVGIDWINPPLAVVARRLARHYSTVAVAFLAVAKILGHTALLSVSKIGAVAILAQFHIGGDYLIYARTLSLHIILRTRYVLHIAHRGRVTRCLVKAEPQLYSTHVGSSGSVVEASLVVGHIHISCSLVVLYAVVAVTVDLGKRCHRCESKCCQK